MPLVSVENLNVSIGKKCIIKDMSFALQKGEILCILGKNGSGKSTLLKTILGILEYSGSLKLQNKECKEYSNHARSLVLSYVPQIEQSRFNFTLLEVVLMGRFARSSFFNYSKADKNKALEILERLNLSAFAHENFSTLSGGQKQLGLIARALAQDSEILVLDEPVSALDISYSFKFLEIIKSLQKTIILTSHHPEQCFIADKILMIKNGTQICFDSMQNALVEEKINQLYDISTTCVILPNNGRYFCQTFTC